MTITRQRAPRNCPRSTKSTYPFLSRDKIRRNPEDPGKADHTRKAWSYRGDGMYRDNHFYARLKVFGGLLWIVNLVNIDKKVVGLAFDMQIKDLRWIFRNFLENNLSDSIYVVFPFLFVLTLLVLRDLCNDILGVFQICRTHGSWVIIQ